MGVMDGVTFIHVVISEHYKERLRQVTLSATGYFAADSRVQLAYV